MKGYKGHIFTCKIRLNDSSNVGLYGSVSTNRGRLTLFDVSGFFWIKRSNVD